MALVNAVGFELASDLELYNNGINAVTVYSSNTKKSGLYSLQLSPDDSELQYVTIGGNTASGLHASFADLSLTGEFFVTFWFRMSVLPILMPIAGFKSSSFHTAALTVNSDGEVYAQGSTDSDVAATIQTNRWYRAKFRVTQNATSYLSIDGGSEVSFTARDEAPTFFWLGTGPFVGGGAYTCFYDDVVISNDDDFVEGEVHLLEPTGAGNYSGWSGGTSSLFSAVDEVPNDGDTTYIKTTSNSAASTFDLQTMSDAGLTDRDVYATVAWALMRSESSNPTASLRVRSNGTDYDTTSAAVNTVTWSASATPGLSPARHRIMATNPNGGAAWDDTAVDLVEVGVLSGTLGGIGIRCTFVGLMVLVAYADQTVTPSGVTSAAAIGTPIGYHAFNTVSSFTATPSNSLAKVTLSWDATDISSSDFGRFRIYRQIGSGDAELITTLTDPLVTEYVDYFAPSVHTLTYTMTQSLVVGTTEIEGDSVEDDTSLTFREMWLTDVVDSSYRVSLLDNPQRNFTVNRDEESVRYWGDRAPTKHIGVARYKTFSVSVDLFGPNKNTSPTEDWTWVISMLEDMLERRNAVCYVDGRGRRIFAHFSMAVTDQLPGHYSVQLTFEETQFTEGE